MTLAVFFLTRATSSTAATTWRKERAGGIFCKECTRSFLLFDLFAVEPSEEDFPELLRVEQLQLDHLFRLLSPKSA